jgi:hypothetical protein
MGKEPRRFVAKAEAGRGWRIWDKPQKLCWGPVFATMPEDVLAELNGAKRPEELTTLMQKHNRPTRFAESS